jgi:phosphate transport system permease protein
MSPLYAARRRRDLLIRALCFAAAGLGLLWLGLILWSLFANGVAGLSLDIFTKSTPPPGSSGGGLANAIFGSLAMTILGVAIGAPLGMMAGAYLAEYGRYEKLSDVVRFINDILLSAPSIIVGLFIYIAVVQTTGGFSGYAGALALAVIVTPVVVRTTEDMLLLVPNQLREAASALGLPRSLVIRRVAFRAARAGVITGVLLATALKLKNDTVLFAGQARAFFASQDQARSVAAQPVAFTSAVATLIELADGRLLALGEAGATVFTLPTPPARP